MGYVKLDFHKVWGGVVLRFLLLLCVFASSFGINCAELDFDSSMQTAIVGEQDALEAFIADRVIAIDWISYAYEIQQVQKIPILLKGRLDLTDPQKSYEVVLNMFIHEDFSSLKYIFPLIFPSLSEYLQQSLIKALFFDKSISINIVVFLLSQAIQTSSEPLDLKKLFWEAFQDDDQVTPAPFFIDMLQDPERQSFKHDKRKYITKAFAHKNYPVIAKALCWAAFELDENALVFMIDQLHNVSDVDLKTILNNKSNQYMILCSALYASDIPNDIVKLRRKICLKLGFTISPGQNNVHTIFGEACLKIAQSNEEENAACSIEELNEFFSLNFGTVSIARLHIKLKILKKLLREYDFDASPEFLKQACELHPSLGFGTFVLLKSFEHAKVLRFPDLIGYGLVELVNN